MVLEPGADPIPLIADRYSLTLRGGRVVLEAWDDSRNLVRRVRAIVMQKRARLDLEIERFGSKPGVLSLLDLADASNRTADRRGARLKYREQFRRSLSRQFPGWRIAELSTEPDLHHSLSPAFPRALLRKGSMGIAAIGAAADSLSPEGVLSFGLIWLDYLRKRETKFTIEALALFVPSHAQSTTCHRVRYLNENAARFLIYVHHQGMEDMVNPADSTNFETRIEPCHHPATHPWADRLSAIPNVERRDRSDGASSFAIRGLEFARIAAGEVLFGIDHKIAANSEAHFSEIQTLAEGIGAMRSARARDRVNPLYMRNPEAWLESEVRRSIDQIDADLHSHPVYGQVPEFASGDRSVIDLLAISRAGQLAVIEIKADQDIHLPLQALDYWMRVRWHLDRGEFELGGYFQGVPIANRAPRLYLVAPALDFHPTNEIVMKYFKPEIPAERIGVGLEWRQELRIMFRSPATPWHSPYYAR